MTIEDQEKTLAASIQKPIINRFCIGVNAQVVSVVFFETAETPYARSAICMPAETAEMFYETLGKVLSDIHANERRH